MFIYRTNWFEGKIREQGNLYEQINRLCDDLATMSVDEVQSRFERIYPFLKRKERNLRLVARIYRVDKTPILCWLTLFRRGDRAYEEFLRDREHYNHQPWAGDIEENQLRSWLKQQKPTLTDTPPPPLPDQLRPWLERPNWVVDTNHLFIYESQTWVEQFQTPGIHQHWKHYNALLIDLADQRDPLEDLLDPQWGVRLFGRNQHFILYAHVITKDEYPREILFLLSPFQESPSESEVAAIINKNPINFNQPLSLDDLTNWTQRAYPIELIVSEESWLAIEDELATNLALSAEEETILHSVSTASPSLPLFLNGQAGSGKSTMLFHLFADYCYRHFCRDEKQQSDLTSSPHPLFLAYNERLLEVAKEQVATLLKYHHRFTQDQKIVQPRHTISPFFQTFRHFLRQLLPPADKKRFSPEKYISFHRFRQLCRRHLPRYSPEKCWLVIRTFIKGYHLDEREQYLTIEDYQEIPNKEKALADEEFIDIYNQVWHWYYQYTRNHKEWDDQDLIRWILHHQYYTPKYTAIFCDEAQDFTRLELQLIMRLSVFSQYDLEHEYVPSLPFAFAGDPLQTLNPTGFRWASLKATFYNEVLTVLSPSGNLNLEMNFQELVCNYRSFPAIVGVNNLIQLWRKYLFDLPEIEPQTSRKIGDRAPQKFILETNISPEEAKQYLQDSLIILPCDEAGEKDYVQQDDLLSDLFSQARNGSQPWNMLSAIAAKGLEFKQVILYKFGEQCPNQLFSQKNNTSAKVKYFLNKLYVAVSRATEQLLIVDTARGEQKLWQYTTETALIENFLQSSVSNSEKWQTKIHQIQWGDSPENLGKDDPKAIADTFMKQGLNSQDPDLMWRAQQAYQRLKEEELARYCEAVALKLEGNLIAAGNCFLAQQDLASAWECFWQGMGWEELINLSQTLSEFSVEDSKVIKEQLEKNYPLIQYMAQALINTSNHQQLEPFTKFLLSYLPAELPHLNQQWQTALNTYFKQIHQLLQQGNQQQEFLQNLADSLGKLGKRTKQTQFLKLAGDCFYKIENYQQALTYWEASGNTQQRQYYQAKAYYLGMPKGLEYLVRLGANQEIVKAWEKAKKPFTKEWLTYVAPVLEANQNYDLAARSYCYLNQKEKVQSCFQKITSPHNNLISFLLTYYLHFQYWEDFIALLENNLSQLRNQSTNHYFSIIIRLANSKLTPNSLNIEQRQRLETLFRNQISDDAQANNFPVYHLGVALEKMGLFVESLKYYERFLNNKKQPNLCQFSRQRWLAVKQKQAHYFQQQGRTNKASYLKKELNRCAKHWKLDLETISSHPPKLSQKVVPKKSPQTKPSLQVPPNTKIQSFPKKGIIQLQLRHLEIKVMQTARQVLITDLLTQQTLRIDGLTHQIKVGEIILKSEGKTALSFMSPSGSFGGRLTPQQERYHLELHIQGISEKVQFSF